MVMHSCIWPGERADWPDAMILSSSLTCPGGAGARAETGIAGRLRALLRGRTGRPDAIKVAGISPELIQEAAEATEGFSGRELAKLVASMQASTAFYIALTNCEQIPPLVPFMTISGSFPIALLVK